MSEIQQVQAEELPQKEEQKEATTQREKITALVQRMNPQYYFKKFLENRFNKFQDQLMEFIDQMPCDKEAGEYVAVRVLRDPEGKAAVLIEVFNKEHTSIHTLMPINLSKLMKKLDFGEGIMEGAMDIKKQEDDVDNNGQAGPSEHATAQVG